MARPMETDFLQNHRFVLEEVRSEAKPVFSEKEGGNPFLGLRGSISCASISLPTISAETTPINEGTEAFTHHVHSGRAVGGEVELAWAVVPFGGIDMYRWLHMAIFGNDVARKDFLVHHMTDGLVKARTYHLEGCLPISWTPTTALDANSDDVSIETLTMDVHRVVLHIPAKSVVTLGLNRVVNPFSEAVSSLPPPQA